jgi:hypothetical protein
MSTMGTDANFAQYLGVEDIKQDLARMVVGFFTLTGGKVWNC